MIEILFIFTVIKYILPYTVIGHQGVVFGGGITPDLTAPPYFYIEGT